MLDHQTYRAQQELHKRLPHDDWANFSCPTVVAVPITPNNRVVMVQPVRADPHGWIFPQGKIEQRNETLFEAAKRVLKKELAYPSDMFISSEAKLIGKGAANYDRGKQYYVIALGMKRWQQPRLNGENLKHCEVGGPGELMQKIGKCSQAKKQLIKQLLITAIEQQLLYSPRWCSGHAKVIIHSL